MQKVVLSEVDLYHGEIMPKGFEIDQNKIRNNIIESYIQRKRISSNHQDYAFDDYECLFLSLYNGFKIILRDHFNAEYEKTLVFKNMHGNILIQRKILDKTSS